MALIPLCVRSLSARADLNFNRLRYSVGDLAALATLYKTTSYLDKLINPGTSQLPHSLLYEAAKLSLWTIYTFWAGLIGTGLWIIAHECGHQAFSDSKFLNNAVGWVLHSGWVYGSVRPGFMVLTPVF